jgi:hypothetical protein
MTMSPEHADLHRMVDRLDPDQARALRAVAQQLLRPIVGHPISARAPATEPDRHHEACTAQFRRFHGPIIVPAPNVTEVAYFLPIEPAPAVEAEFPDALARSELIVEATTAQDFARMAGLVRQYPDFQRRFPDAPRMLPSTVWARPRRQTFTESTRAVSRLSRGRSPQVSFLLGVRTTPSAPLSGSPKTS